MSATILTFAAKPQPANWRDAAAEEISRARQSRLLLELDRCRTALAEIMNLPTETEFWGDELRAKYQRAQEIGHEALYPARPKFVA
jgi:hypothetical protein